MTKRILVVDDEKLVRWSLRKSSVRFGDEVLEVEGGQEGLDEKGARGRLLRSDSEQVYAQGVVGQLRT